MEQSETIHRISMSISKETAKSKESAGKLVEYRTMEVDLNANFDLEDIFTHHNYSLNVWKDGRCCKQNYIGMTGIALDFDEGVTLDQARERFAPYIYIIHTTTSHQVTKGKNPPCDRFRVILPFKPTNDPYYPTLSAGERALCAAERMFPTTDKSTFEPARKFFPFLGEEDNFICEVNLNGTWFAITPEQLQAEDDDDGTTVAPKVGFGTTSSYSQASVERQFNQEVGVRAVLLRNGYDRDPHSAFKFRHPDSTSGLYGLTIYPDGHVYSFNANDLLYDRRPHTAFDCMRLLECGGSWAKAYRLAEAELGIQPLKLVRDDEPDTEALCDDTWWQYTVRCMDDDAYGEVEWND